MNFTLVSFTVLACLYIGLLRIGAGIAKKNIDHRRLSFMYCAVAGKPFLLECSKISAQRARIPPSLNAPNKHFPGEEDFGCELS